MVRGVSCAEGGVWTKFYIFPAYFSFLMLWVLISVKNFFRFFQFAFDENESMNVVIIQSGSTFPRFKMSGLKPAGIIKMY